VDTVAKKLLQEKGSRKKITAKLREHRALELKKWGYTEGDPPEQLAQAEASAEAASGHDRIVPLTSLAHRRFRTEVLEPLLTVPKGEGKGKDRGSPAPEGGKPAGPKGRLARAVKELLESGVNDEQERKRLAKEMAGMLRMVGIRPDHPLRKRLDKYCALVT